MIISGQHTIPAPFHCFTSLEMLNLKAPKLPKVWFGVCQILFDPEYGLVWTHNTRLIISNINRVKNKLTSKSPHRPFNRYHYARSTSTPRIFRARTHTRQLYLNLPIGLNN